MFFGLVFKECSFHLSYGQGRNHLLKNVNLICIWMNVFPTRLPISNSEECHVRWCCSRQVSSREWMYSIVYSQFSEIHNSFLSGLLRMNIFFNRKKKIPFSRIDRTCPNLSYSQILECSFFSNPRMHLLFVLCSPAEIRSELPWSVGRMGLATGGTQGLMGLVILSSCSFGHQVKETSCCSGGPTMATSL